MQCRHYVRYVDDLVFLAANPERLYEYRNRVADFLKTKLELAANPRKTSIQPLSCGLDFLGYHLKPGNIFPKYQVTGRYKDKLYRAATGRCRLAWKKLQSIAASYQGHCSGVGA